jgi:hypothetical protein
MRYATPARSSDTGMANSLSYREAPVGIEPMNRGFAVVREPLGRTLSPSIPLHKAHRLFGNTSSLCTLLLRVVPRMCPGIRPDEDVRENRTEKTTRHYSARPTSKTPARAR